MGARLVGPARLCCPHQTSCRGLFVRARFASAHASLPAAGGEYMPRSFMWAEASCLLPAFAQASTPTDQLRKLRRLHTGAFQQRALVGHLVKSEPIFRVSSGKFCVLNIGARCIKKWLYHEQLSLSMLFGFHQCIKLFYQHVLGSVKNQMQIETGMEETIRKDQKSKSKYV